MRIGAGIILMVSLVWGYWWLTLSLAILFVFLFSTYYEIIFFAVMYDALYGVTHTMTIASIFVFLISIFSKRYLIAYTS